MNVKKRACFELIRNWSSDLLCKSIEWFLYDGNFGV